MRKRPHPGIDFGYSPAIVFGKIGDDVTPGAGVGGLELEQALKFAYIFGGFHYHCGIGGTPPVARRHDFPKSGVQHSKNIIGRLIRVPHIMILNHRCVKLFVKQVLISFIGLMLYKTTYFNSAVSPLFLLTFNDCRIGLLANFSGELLSMRVIPGLAIAILRIFADFTIFSSLRCSCVSVR